jgi:hypothetical protein
VTLTEQGDNIRISESVDGNLTSRVRLNNEKQTKDLERAKFIANIIHTSVKCNGAVNRWVSNQCIRRVFDPYVLLSKHTAALKTSTFLVSLRCMFTPFREKLRRGHSLHRRSHVVGASTHAGMDGLIMLIMHLSVHQC